MPNPGRWKQLEDARDRRHALEEKERQRMKVVSIFSSQPAPGPTIRYPICYTNQQLSDAMQSKRYQTQQKRK